MRGFVFFEEWECVFLNGRLWLVFFDLCFPPCGPVDDEGGAGGPPILGIPGIIFAPEGFADGKLGRGPIDGIWSEYTVAYVIAPVVTKIIAYINTGNPYNCIFTISIILY
jgi:hypothetical protein